MQIQLALDSGTPIYTQIERQILYLVGSGRLRPGEELPSIRNLAAQLVVNPNTVARAYRELETAGIVVKHGTAGTFVSSKASTTSTRQRRESLHRRAEELIITAREMGFSVKDVIRAIRECDAEIASPNGGKR